MPGLIRLLDRNEHDVLEPVLQSIYQITSGNDAQVDVALQSGLLNHMKKLLKDSSLKIVGKAAHTFGSAYQIQAVIDAGIFEDIRNIFAHGDICAKIETIYAMANISHRGTLEQIHYLLRRGVIEPFCHFILLNDAGLDVVIKKALNVFFNVVESEVFKFASEDSGAADLLEKLNQLHLN